MHPDIAEDRRRYEEFKRTRLAVPLDDVKAWVASWGSANELPRPTPTFPPQTELQRRT